MWQPQKKTTAFDRLFCVLKAIVLYKRIYAKYEYICASSADERAARAAVALLISAKQHTFFGLIARQVYLYIQTFMFCLHIFRTICKFHRHKLTIEQMPVKKIVE